MKQVQPVENRQVVLVDKEDNRLGTMGILEAHSGGGVMHRAISILLFNSRDEVLLQKRSREKPLWPLFWSNTVCTHPFDGEDYVECGVRRLEEEMGIRFSDNELRRLYRFDYQAKYDDKLSEFELDTVLVGRFDGEMKPNKEEVDDFKWVGWNELKKDIEKNPDVYTPWFKMIVESGGVDEWLGVRV